MDYKDERCWISSLVDFPFYAWSLRTHDRRLRHFDIFFNDVTVKVDQVMKAVETELNGPGKLWDTAQCIKNILTTQL